MDKICFINDYQEGCLPEISKIMSQENFNANSGYGTDVHCEIARAIIREKINAPNADVHFVSGGTLTNKIVISFFLKSYEGVICADTAHVATHETGAIESVGRKLLTVKNHDGKILPEQIEMLVNEHIEGLSREHTVKPGMVYISQSTELGTVYTLEELTAISNVCKKHGLFFYIDGARLLYSIFAKNCNFTLSQICNLCDVIYIGGTKVGALLGEALVINNAKLGENFRYVLKQNGALMAKGFVMGMQFVGLLKNDNYKKYCKKAVELADKIREALAKKAIRTEVSSFDTQTLAIFTCEQYAQLEKCFDFGGATVKNGFAYARICTSWSTKEENVNALIKAIENL